MIEIKNGRIVTPYEVIENKSILIEDGVIKDICEYSGKADRSSRLISLPTRPASPVYTASI